MVRLLQQSLLPAAIGRPDLIEFVLRLEALEKLVTQGESAVEFKY